MPRHRWVWWLLPTWAFGLRLWGLRGFAFVNEDAATYLRFDLLVHTQRLPLYAIVVNTAAAVGLDRLFAAQLVSALSAALAVYLLQRAAVSAGIESRFAWLAGVTPAADPFFALITVQAMTEGLFALWCALALLCFFRFRESGGVLHAFGTILVFGLACLTRAEGLVLVLPAAWVVVRLLRERRRTDLCLAFSGLAPWLLNGWWHRLLGHAGYAREFSLHVRQWPTGWGDAIANVGLNGVSVLAHHLGLGALFALLGFVVLARRRNEPTARVVLTLSGSLAVLTWLGLGLHWYFDWRFASALTVWLALPFAYGARHWLAGRLWRRVVTGAALLVMLAGGTIIGGGLIWCSSKLAPDIREIAACVRQQSPSAAVLADQPAMLAYHADRSVLPYNWNTMVRLNGAVVVLSTRWTNLGLELSNLEREGYRPTFLGHVFFHGPRCGDNRKSGQTAALFISRRPGTPAGIRQCAGMLGPDD
jgi:hypothetical protein